MQLRSSLLRCKNKKNVATPGILRRLPPIAAGKNAAHVHVRHVTNKQLAGRLMHLENLQSLHGS